MVRCTLVESALTRALRIKFVLRGVYSLPMAINSTYFGLLAEFGEANVPLEKVAPKYFGLSFAEARRRAPAKMLPCRVFRLGGQKSPWLVSVVDLADLIDASRERGS